MKTNPLAIFFAVLAAILLVAVCTGHTQHIFGLATCAGLAVGLPDKKPTKKTN